MTPCAANRSERLRAWLCRPLSRALGMVLPRACVGCGLIVDNESAGLCTGCLTALPGRAAVRCGRCAIRLASSGDEYDAAVQAPPICAACRQRPEPFDASFALCQYATPVDQMIHALKFQRRWSLGQALGVSLGMHRGQAVLDYAASRLTPGQPMPHQSMPHQLMPHQSMPHKSAIQSPTIHLCPIPLSDDRLLERGFNQARLLASGVRQAMLQTGRSHRFRPQLSPVLTRARDTLPQTLVEPRHRINNLDAAFNCRADCAGQIVVLVDDVMTSGATLASAARTLKAAGAAMVINLVLARA